MPVSRSLRRLIAVAVIATAGLAAAGPATAIPILNLRASDNGFRVNFRATLRSPANAVNCTANVTVRMVAGQPLRTFKILANHRINVCRTGSRGVTYGSLSGFFNTSNTRSGRYAILVTATQRLRNGNRSRHSAIKLFTHFAP